MRDEKGELWYSSEHWLEDFELDQIPPVGLVFRFDVPSFDDDGRWGKWPDGSYYIDSGDPIRAKVTDVEAHVDDDTLDRIVFYHVDLETDEGDVEDFAANWPKCSEKTKVEKLLEFRQHLLDLKHASTMKVADSRSGFSEEQSHFLQRKMCETVADVSNRFIGSFHKDEMSMVESVEKTLKEKWNLMFCAGPGWLCYQGPSKTEETQKTSKRRSRKMTTLEELAEIPLEDRKRNSVLQLGLRKKTEEALSSAEILNIGQLSSKTASELLGIRYFSKRSLQECREKLRAIGIKVNWF